ncbi:MAG: AAA family ATPase [Candidatus Methanomethylophilus sp.]|nr:AAA family ATPase [Methanomethylophilus sp.]
MRGGSVTQDILKKVTIQGFKSIKDSTVDLSTINVLIGPNGSGKSNFISALYFLQNILEKNLAETVSRIGLPALLYNGPKVTKKISMEFTFGNNSYGFELTPNENGGLIFADEYYGWGEGKWPVKRNVPFGTESEFEKGVRNGIDSYVKPVLAARNWRVYHFHDTSVNSSMKQVGNMSDAVSLHHDASNLAPFLFLLKHAHPEEYRNIVSTVKYVAPFFGDFVLEPNPENEELIRLRWKQVGCDEVFGVNQLSDGTLRFICLSVLLLQPPHLQPSTIILDEPELGLHPSAISMLSDLIRKASLKKQIIVSTQSTELLDNFTSDNVIVTEIGPSGSVYRRLSKSELKNWLNEYTLSDIWKKNIIGGLP